MSLRVPVLTPFNAEGKADLNALTNFISWLVKKGCEEFWLLGTTGEFSSLRYDEKVKVIHAASLAIHNHGKRVMVGIHHGDITGISALGVWAHIMGAGAMVLMTPIYLRVSQREIVEHYRGARKKILRDKFVRRHAPLPLYAYAHPVLSGNDIELSSLEELVSEGVIAGIKYSSTNEERLKELIARFSGRIEVCVGTERKVLWARNEGAHGCVAGLANAFPELAFAAWEGNEEADKRFAEISEELSFLSGTSKISAIKYLASARSGIKLGTRSPILPPIPEDTRQLDKILEKCG